MTAHVAGILVLAIPVLLVWLEWRFWYSLGAEGLRTPMLWYRAAGDVAMWFALLFALAVHGLAQGIAIAILLLAFVGCRRSNRLLMRATSSTPLADRAGAYLESRCD